MVGKDVLRRFEGGHSQFRASGAGEGSRKMPGIHKVLALILRMEAR